MKRRSGFGRAVAGKMDTSDYITDYKLFFCFFVFFYEIRFAFFIFFCFCFVYCSSYRHYN